MSKTFELTLTTPGADIAFAHIKIAGTLESEEALAKIQLPGHVGHITFDLEDWKSMNSIGIRAFLLWIKKIEDRRMVFTKCPKFFIDQLNMIQGLVPAGARIESFFVPFYSEQSSETVMILYRNGSEFVHGPTGDYLLRHPAVADKDGNACELDVPEAKYFSFLSRYR